MFKRLLLDDSAGIFTLVAFITAATIYVTISWRALKMKRPQLERFENLPFDTARDISGVTTLIENPLVLVTGQARGYKTVADLVAAGKARPGSINFASGGFGTSTHISAEKFRMAAGFEAVDGWFKTTASDMARDASRDDADTGHWWERWERGGFDMVEKFDDRV